MGHRSIDYLALHSELGRMVACAPRSRLAERARELQAVVARLALADIDRLVDRVNPVAGVTHAAELALDAGANWQEVVASLTRLRTLRPDHGPRHD